MDTIRWRLVGLGLAILLVPSASTAQPPPAAYRTRTLTLFRAVQSAPGAFRVPRTPDVIVPSLREAARLEGLRFAGSPAGPSPQSAGGAPKTRAVKRGALIGASVGLAGGALQPTHSNGEYVLGSNRATSALVLGGIGAGVGALVGLAIEKSRKPAGAPERCDSTASASPRILRRTDLLLVACREWFGVEFVDHACRAQAPTSATWSRPAAAPSCRRSPRPSWLGSERDALRCCLPEVATRRRPILALSV